MLVLATTQRSGGTWLSSLMEASGRLGRPEEWLLPGTVLGWGLRHGVATLRPASIPNCALHRSRVLRGRELYAVYLDAVRHASLPRYFTRLIEEESTPNGVFSIHLQWDHLEVLERRWSGSILGVADRTEFVHLWREDQLAQAVSWYRARATNRWTSSQSERTIARYDGEEIRRRFLMVCERNRLWREWFDDRGIIPLEISYEQVLADQTTALDSILRLVGEVPDASPTESDGRLVVQRGAESAEWIDRFICDFPELRETRYRRTGGPSGVDDRSI